MPGPHINKPLQRAGPREIVQKVKRKVRKQKIKINKTEMTKKTHQTVVYRNLLAVGCRVWV